MGAQDVTSQKALDNSWVQDGSPGECRMGVLDACKMVPYNNCCKNHMINFPHTKWSIAMLKRQPPSCTHLENHPAPSYCLRLSVMSLHEPPPGAGISAYLGWNYYSSSFHTNQCFVSFDENVSAYIWKAVLLSAIMYNVPDQIVLFAVSKMFNLLTCSCK